MFLNQCVLSDYKTPEYSLSSLRKFEDFASSFSFSIENADISTVALKKRANDHSSEMESLILNYRRDSKGF